MKNYLKMKTYIAMCMAVLGMTAHETARAQGVSQTVDNVTYAIYEYNNTAGAVNVASGVTDVVIAGEVQKDGKTYKVEMVEDNFAAGNTDVTSVTIGEGVKYLGIGVFHDCVKLAKVTIPSSLEAIFEEAFDGCTALAEKPKI